MGDTVNALNTNVDLSVRIFDVFYGYETFVNAEEYDVVYSYMRSVFTTDQAAGNFTVALFRIAEETGTPVLNLLQNIEGQDSIVVTQTLAYYLNNMRSGSTLLGFGVNVTPNYYTARNVLA
jgi:pyruvate/2-oxoacid:ferredoxin oxidoreductase alpha subunit